MVVNWYVGDEPKERYVAAEGVTNFKVTNATDTISKKGNAMIKLELTLMGNSAGDGVIYDYLLMMPNTAWKIKQFLLSVGLGHLNRPEGFRTDVLIGKMGSCEIAHEESEQYGLQSRVGKYLPKEVSKDDKESDDDLPF